MIVDCKCGSKWSGTTVEHCTACHRTFSGSTTGDRHRVGRHELFTGPNRRRCLTVAEMAGLRTRSDHRDGHPVLVQAPNRYGTVIWRHWAAQKRSPHLFGDAPAATKEVRHDSDTRATVRAV
jgi:hypothetical protein